MRKGLELTPAASALIRDEIAKARGNEVCFIARVGEDGDVDDPRVVARGHRAAVLAAVRDAAPGMIVIHNHPSGELDPSDADLAVASVLHQQGLGLAITDNAARSLYVVVEPARVEAPTPLEEALVREILAPGGPIEREHGAYEDRPTQRDLAAAVARAYSRGGVLLAEAGTGTGKTVAYLVPAVLWALENRERTLVSTNTIQLQEQLVTKDLPFLRRALELPFTFALVKGRNNYVSIRRARLAAETAGSLFEDNRRAELDAILAWLETTRDGSIQDLPFMPTPEVWDEVASDTDVCMRGRCPHFQACFYQRARRDSAAANILVVNHHLLFSDLAVRRASDNYAMPAVLPWYRRLILDEAHNIEDAATEHLGVGVSRVGVARVLARLDRRGRGLLTALASAVSARGDELTAAAVNRVIAEEVRPAVERARELALELFDVLEGVAAGGEGGAVRLEPGAVAVEPWRARLDTLADSLLLALERLSRGLASLRSEIQGQSALASALEEILIELNGAAERVRITAASLRLVLEPCDPFAPMVRWVERKGEESRTNVVLRAAPVEVAGVLAEALFERVDTVVLTSATLTTTSGFDYMRSRLGLDRGGIKLEEAVYASPFDFETQTLVAVPTDLPDPRGAAGVDFEAAIAGVVEEFVRITDGGVFVLLTSHRSLQRLAERLRKRNVHHRWPIFCQGEDDRARLLRGFIDNGRGVLLGVASFWEGVDVPGDPLRGLVITQLPFRVPTEPLTAARIEAVEAMGGDSFRDFMLPHAALRLKQGFGRLIRTRRDRGAVVILDRRIVTKRYGRYLLESLPPAPVSTGDWAHLRSQLEAFYGQFAASRAASR